MAQLPLYINGRFLTQRSTGVQRFAAETLHALDELLGDRADPAPPVTVLAPPGAAQPELRNMQFRQVGAFGGHLWEQLVLPWESRHGFLLSFGPTGPVVHGRQLVTIHDAAVHAVPDAYSRAFRTWYKLLLPILIKRTGKVATVSHFSKHELERYFGAKSHQVRVVTEGWQHVMRAQPDPSILEQYELVDKPFILAVSSVTAHKNFGVIVRALPEMKHSDATIVVAGAADNPLFSQLPAQSLARLHLVGYVADAQLRALYEHATAFVHPSRYEGFGLPPLEAMALGCPVVCSNAAALPETCGRAALFFSPEDHRELAGLLDRVLSEPELRNELRAAGQQRVREFSWERAATSYLEMLRPQGSTQPLISEPGADAENHSQHEQPSCPT